VLWRLIEPSGFWTMIVAASSPGNGWDGASAAAREDPGDDGACGSCGWKVEILDRKSARGAGSSALAVSWDGCARVGAGWANLTAAGLAVALAASGGRGAVGGGRAALFSGFGTGAGAAPPWNIASFALKLSFG
jgi:hypothetical protein